MENVFEIGLLLDFYGQLLTQRQYEIMDMHFNNDYSLGEIGEELNISRQGVFDNIKRGKAALYELENKLGLLQRFSEQKRKAEELLHVVSGIDKAGLTQKNLEAMDRIEAGIRNMIETI